jgi:hypothetical protein
MDLEGEASKTFNVDEPVLPLPPFVEVTVPVVLAYAPPAAATTEVVIVQLLFAGIDPPVKETEPTPAVAVNVPPHVLDVTAGVVFTKPVGYVSVNATPVSAVAVFEFEIVSVSVDATFAVVGLGEKDFVIAGGARTVTTFVLALLVSSTSAITLPGSTVAVLDKLPVTVGVTANVTLNEAPVGNVTAPFATQLRLGPVTIEQFIVPVGAVPPGVTVNDGVRV